MINGNAVQDAFLRETADHLLREAQAEPARRDAVFYQLLGLRTGVWAIRGAQSPLSCHVSDTIQAVLVLLAETNGSVS